MTPERRRELQAAYLDADYRVDGPEGRFTIRVGRNCPSLDALLRREQSTDWAFITACNPYSQQLSDHDNAIRMNHLVADLTVAGQRVYPGESVARDDSWPPEPSLLILDLDERAAVEIASRYGQLAIVAGQIGEPARLVWIAADRTSNNQIT
jgi:hypothetical protein